MVNGNNILSIFNLDNIRLYQNACLNFLNSKQVCQDCLTLCPYQAISFENNLPVINCSKCTECGLCTAVCPTLALDNERYPYTDIHNQLSKYPLATISCEKDQLHNKGIKLPCLLTVDLPLLIKLSKHHSTLNLYVGGCTTCLTAPLTAIRLHFSTLQSELLALNSQLEIRLTDEPFIETQAEPVSGLTRRELLQSFSLKKFKEFEFVKEDKVALHEDNKQHLKERVLYKREIIAEHLKSTHSISYSGPLADRYLIEIANSCNGCDICTTVCPTNALYWQDDNEFSSLYFDSALCIGCEKCILCGANAIKIHTINYADGEQVSEPIELISFMLNHCQTCGDYFRSNERTELCPICDKQQNRESYFTNL